MAKEKKWNIRCHLCKVSVELGVEQVYSTDQGAEFLKKPTYICGKCRSDCTVKLAGG